MADSVVVLTAQEQQRREGKFKQMKWDFARTAGFMDMPFLRQLFLGTRASVRFAKHGLPALNVLERWYTELEATTAAPKLTKEKFGEFINVIAETLAPTMFDAFFGEISSVLGNLVTITGCDGNSIRNATLWKLFTTWDYNTVGLVQYHVKDGDLQKDSPLQLFLWALGRAGASPYQQFYETADAVLGKLDDTEFFGALKELQKKVESRVSTLLAATSPPPKSPSAAASGAGAGETFLQKTSKEPIKASPSAAPSTETPVRRPPSASSAIKGAASHKAVSSVSNEFSALPSLEKSMTKGSSFERTQSPPDPRVKEFEDLVAFGARNRQTSSIEDQIANLQQQQQLCQVLFDLKSSGTVGAGTSVPITLGTLENHRTRIQSDLRMALAKQAGDSRPRSASGEGATMKATKDFSTNKSTALVPAVQAATTTKGVTLPTLSVKPKECYFHVENTAQIPVTEEELRRLFRKYDVNNDGFINKWEFARLHLASQTNSDLGWDEEEFRKVLSQYNLMGDNKLSYDEFCIIMLKMAQF